MSYKPSLFDLAEEPAPLPTAPTALIASVSGGVDSVYAALWLDRQYPVAAYPDIPRILWHAHLDQMDWPQTSDYLDYLQQCLGPAWRRVTIQAVYELTGATTPSGFQSIRRRRLHDVAAEGPATDSDPAALTNLLDLARHARNGMPPTKKLRWCSDFTKIAPFEGWVVANRAMLGTDPVLVSGERRYESDTRKHLPAWEWRLALRPSTMWPAGWRMLWVRPGINLRLHEVIQAVADADIDLHPGYAIQGETLAALADPGREEHGRARLSCVICIFTKTTHLRTALERDPETVTPIVARGLAFEAETGRTWQQSGPLPAIAAEDGVHASPPVPP